MVLPHKLSASFGVYMVTSVVVLVAAGAGAETIGLAPRWALALGFTLSFPINYVREYCKDVEAGIRWVDA